MAKLAVALVAAAILLICISRVSAHKTHNVTFYVHDSILVPNAKALIVAGPGGDLTKLQKGAILVTDTVITKHANPGSDALGKLRDSISSMEASSIASRRPSSSTSLEIWWKPRTRSWGNAHHSTQQTIGRLQWWQVPVSSRAKRDMP
jgi:hypothetical protein